MSYTEFADALSECMVSVWVDDESTFGTFPLESMKCGVPVIGKIPDQEPEWLGENGMWTYDGNKIAEILGTYVLSWLEGIELSDEVKDKMKEAYLTYNKLSHAQSTISIFDSLIKIRLDSLTNALDKFSHKEDKEENKND
jgi:glycosyltransferase involved in cell wall biosynthesis